MKTIQTVTLAAVLSIALGSGANAQEQKKIHIYLDMEKNGDQSIIDTSFTTHEELENYLKSKGLETPKAIDVADVEDVAEMKEIIINIDDMDFSPQKKAELKAEMEKAKKEMKKAVKEMEIHKGEMEKHQKEMENAHKELKMMKIEINESENGSPKKIIILSSGDGEKQTWNTDEDIIIHLDEKSNNYDYKIIRLNDNENSAEEQKVKVIRKVEKVNDSVIEESNSEIKSNDEVPSEKNPETKTNYQLTTSDFKIFPNPTQGKITVSFRTEKDGPVSVKLLDANGRVVVDEEVQVLNGFFSAEYNIEGKAKGIYLLQLKQGEDWRHEKIVMK